ncbi:MAG: hypothetical protein MR536_08750 [Prevotella sp.]|nr:hypothetical protein [Prevotella sp.]
MKTELKEHADIAVAMAKLTEKQATACSVSNNTHKLSKLVFHYYNGHFFCVILASRLRCLRNKLLP